MTEKKTAAQKNDANVEKVMNIAEHLLLCRYRWTSKEAVRFKTIVMTQYEGNELPVKVAENKKRKAPIKSLLKSKTRTAIQHLDDTTPEQKKEMEERTKKLEDELRKKGLLMESKK